MFSKSRTEPSANPRSARSPKGNGALSILAADVVITGDVRAAGEIQIDGAIEGDLTCGALTLGESGSIKGHVRADQATIRGHVNGTIIARSVLFERTARVSGDVTHESISIEVGAQVDGRLVNKVNPLEADADGQATPALKAVVSNP